MEALHAHENSPILKDMLLDATFQKQPTTISDIHRLIVHLDTSYQKEVEDGDIKIEFLNQKPGKIHFLLTISGIKYFLKEVSEINNKSDEGGLEEFEDSVEAAHILKDTPGVLVLQSSFAFYDTVHKKKYNGTAWNPSAEKPLSRIFTENENPTTPVVLTEEKLKDLQDRIEIIKEKLSHFKDVTIDNMGYNIHTDTIVVFDLNKERHQALRECSDDEL